MKYPDGHIIRFYERVLKTEFGMTSGKMLDFGCGNGVHSFYMHDKGFDTYGCDVSAKAIEEVRIGGVAR